ncbi:DUF5064 family protein [Pseudomonas sp. TMP25]|uniref:DUF5064 family protein n=1 Tax=Pseudomonas sp. TMP25 TaxID=3136561 RepID=UPI0031010293
MFKAGHLHRANLTETPGMPAFSIDIHYQVRTDATEGQMVHFHILGEVQGTPFEESVELHRDTVFNFASTLTRIAEKHGLHPKFGAVLAHHKEYDQMFEDIRSQVHGVSGEAINFDHLRQDGF